MQLLLIPFVLLLTFVSSLKAADIEFEIEKLNSNCLRLIKREKGIASVFDKIINLTTFQEEQSIGWEIKREAKGLLINYSNQATGAQFKFGIADRGDIHMLTDNHNTLYDKKLVWGFKTSGKFINNTNSLFYNLLVQAQETYNLGIIKAYTGSFKQHYLFNQGIFHFGEETGFVIEDAYTDYWDCIDSNAKPNYQKGIIDDYGVVISHTGLVIEGLTHKAYGFVDIAKDLILKNASIENHGIYNTGKGVKGNAKSLNNSGEFYPNYIQRDFNLDNFTNTGVVGFRNPTDFYVNDRFDNSLDQSKIGTIYSLASLSIGSAKTPISLGVIVSQDTVKTLINEAMDEATNTEVFNKSRLFAKKRKALLQLTTHTDHYINYITDHYETDKWGFRHFVRKTETGDIFQRRETEVTEQEVEIPDVPEKLQEINDNVFTKNKQLNEFKNRLKDKLKKLAQGNTNKNALFNTLLKGLQDAGLPEKAISDFFKDEQVNSLLHGISHYDLADEQERINLTNTDTDASDFLSKLATSSRNLGQNVWEWTKNNPIELVNNLCNFATAAATKVRHPAVVAVATVCGGRQALLKATPTQLNPNSTRCIKDLNTFYSKKHEGRKGIKITNPQHVGSHSKIIAPKELTAFPEAVSVPPKTYVQGGGGMRKRWKDENYIYEWDSQHGTVEKYNGRGKHLGEFDYKTGEQLKPANPSRVIEP